MGCLSAGTPHKGSSHKSSRANHVLECSRLRLRSRLPHTLPPLESIRVHSRSLAVLFRREGGDDFLEARIAAERVPDREQFQGAVAQHLRCGGSTQSSFQLLQGKLLVARPRCCNGEILKDATAVDDIFFQRRERDRSTAFVQGQVFPPKSSVD